MLVALPEYLEALDGHIGAGLGIEDIEDDARALIRVLFDEVDDAEPNAQQFQQCFLVLGGVIRRGDDAVKRWRRQVRADDNRLYNPRPSRACAVGSRPGRSRLCRRGRRPGLRPGSGR